MPDPAQRAKLESDENRALTISRDPGETGYRMKRLILSHFALLACLAVFSPAAAQQTPAAPATENEERQPTEEEIQQYLKHRTDELEKVGWTREGAGQLGGKAEVAIPKGYRFTGPDGTRKVMAMNDNPPTNKELGMLMTEGLGAMIVFEFDDSGYVKDDEKDKINADEMLAVQRENQKQDNEYRREHGLPELELLGWTVPPHYNEKTNNLEWGLRLKSSEGGISINYNTRLLGREGVMEVTLLCSPNEVEKMIVEQEKILAGFKYVEGQRYAEYRVGDKLAPYGLTALVAGTGVAAAMKMGLFGKLAGFFAKLGKAAILVVIGILAAAKKLLGKLFGVREQPPSV